MTDTPEPQLSNGRTGEWVRMALGLVLAGLIAYFTALGRVESSITEVRERQRNQFEEVLRRLDIMQSDIRELRSRP